MEALRKIKNIIIGLVIFGCFLIICGCCVCGKRTPAWVEWIMDYEL